MGNERIRVFQLFNLRDRKEQKTKKRTRENKKNINNKKIKRGMWENTQKVLKDFGIAFIERYRNGLNEKEANATGNLTNSLNYEINVGEKRIALSIELAEYWRYLEYGSKGEKTSYPEAYYAAHFPPPSEIEKWIIAKPVIPEPRKGKLPTTKQLSYMIANSIYNKGVEPRFIFRDSAEDVWKIFEGELREAISEDVRNDVTEVFKIFDFRKK